MVKYFTNSPFQTKKLGENLAKKFLRSKNKKALVLGLAGDLGGGKTTFLQGLAKGLGIKEKILSPTFVILKKFKITKIKNQKSKIKNLRFKNFYHLDCYRIQRSKEILALGFKEIVANPQNMVVVEWADRIRRIMLKDTIWIKFEFINKNTREIVIE